jgi:putative endonuclease
MYYVYILASKKDGVLYIGVTDNLEKRIYEHKNHLHKGFTDKYFVGKLVYFEETPDVKSAILREKQMKKWNREWKENLINKDNPAWIDLSENFKQ